MSTTIKLYLSQIKYDVETETRKAGFFQTNKDYQEALNEAQMGDEQSDVDYFKRRCQQGIDSLVYVLHKFYVGSSTSGSNVLPTATYWEITLDFDGRRSVQTTSLASICHRYIVYHILYNWAVMTMPNLAESYSLQREAVKLRIQKMVYRKEPPTLSGSGSNTITTNINTSGGSSSPSGGSTAPGGGSPGAPTGGQQEGDQ